VAASLGDLGKTACRRAVLGMVEEGDLDDHQLLAPPSSKEVRGAAATDKTPAQGQCTIEGPPDILMTGQTLPEGRGGLPLVGRSTETVPAGENLAREGNDHGGSLV